MRASTVEVRRRRAKRLRLRHPGWGTCGRCGTPWACTEGHSTPYEWSGYRWQPRGAIECRVSSSMFPLCELCWQELETPEARLPYYEALVLEWNAMGAERLHLTPDYLMECLELEAGVTAA